MSDILEVGSGQIAPQTASSPTLDDLFRRTAARQPDAVALVDPPNKMSITGQPPKRLTYAEADQAIGALAGYFIAAGLPPGSVIAIQLPNTIEFMITVLAATRANLVVALLPQLWRQADITVALNRLGARALVGINRIEIVDHAELAMNAAAEAFSIRHVFGFGTDLPEGMMSLDEVLLGPSESIPMVPQNARRPAIVSFDLDANGFRPVPRNHVNLIAGGLAVFLESGLSQGASLLSAMAPASFAGLASSLVTWLLSGGSLTLHHPFDLQVLEQQIRTADCDTLIVPAPLALRLAEAEAFSAETTIRHVVGLWRTPERVASSPAWTCPHVTLTDIYLFGEVGLFGTRRTDDGLPDMIKPGTQSALRSIPGLRGVGEIAITPQGTLALRGVMVPLAAFQSPQQGTSPLTAAPADDMADTGYAARVERATGAIAITSPPSGIVGVGGYKFLTHELDEWARRLEQSATFTALPDQLNGYRLAGRTSDNSRARAALAELGLNPLMVDAFRERNSAV